MSTLALYRALIPGHSAVAGATVEVFLAQAVRHHTRSQWNVAHYDDAMVYYAAHKIQSTPGMSGVSDSGSSNKGPVRSERAKDTARSYGTINEGIDWTDTGTFIKTVYGQCYWQLVCMQASTGPCLSE